MKRRLFLRAGVLGGAGLVLRPALGQSTPATADRIWTGGPILTMNDKAMRAEAIAEAGGWIIAVGSRTEVMKRRGPRTQVIDLQGRALLPGFVDAHGHVMMGGLQALSAKLLAPPDGEVTDIPGLQRALREWIAANQTAVNEVKLIIGFGDDDAQLQERRHPCLRSAPSAGPNPPSFFCSDAAREMTSCWCVPAVLTRPCMLRPAKRNTDGRETVWPDR